MEENKYILPENRVLALKILHANGKSAHNDFQYPGVGETVTAPDWMPTYDCGHGLHGYLWGQGDISFSLYRPGEVQLFQVHEVNLYVALRDKIKYPSALVVAEFDSIIDALKFIDDYTPQEFRNTTDQVVEVMEYNSKEYGYKTVQDSERAAIQIGGTNSVQMSTESLSLQLAMHNSIQTTINRSFQNAGWKSVQIGEDMVKQITSDLSVQRAACKAVQTGGDKCIQEANGEAMQSAGDYAIQRSGRKSRLSAGIKSIQHAGVGSMCKAGLDSQIFIKYLDKRGYSNGKFAHAFVDGKKIKADTWYKVEDITGKFYEVDYEGNRIPTYLSIYKNRLLARLAKLKDLRW